MRRAFASPSRPPSARRAAPSSPPCDAGSTSTPRPRRSPRRSSACPASRACACPAASTPSSSPCAPSSASRSRSRRRERWRAASSSASAPTSRRRGATSTAPSPARLDLAARADRAHRRARHHPQPRRRDPGARRAAGSRSRRCWRRGAAPDALVERLRELPGIGPWTAHYIAMRALGWPDAFPPGDVAALKAMRHALRDDDAARRRSARRGAGGPGAPTPSSVSGIHLGVTP